MKTQKPSSNQDFPSLQYTITHPIREQLLVLDTQLRVRSASKSFYREFQVTPGQTVGNELANLGNGQWNIPALLTRLNELTKADGELDDLELEHDFQALGHRTMLVSARRSDDTQGGVILLSIRDTTAEKHVEAELGELLIRSRALSSIGKGVIITDPEGRITFMNPAAEKLTGWAHNDALKKQLTDVFNILNEESAQVVENPAARAIRTGDLADFADHTLLIGRNGGEWPIDGNAAPILDNAHITGVVLVFHDISNRRKGERELAISEIRYRRLFESAHDGILILDAVSTKVLDVNPFMADLLGYSKEYFCGKELWEIGVFKDAEMSKRAMASLQRLGRIRYEDLPLQHKDGRHIPVEFVSNVYREGAENVIQCNIRDITERNRLSHELTKAMLDAETANRSKSEFLANMSHEIRTPMGAILGFAEMLLTKSPEECAEIGCIQIIQRNSVHLLELINDILDLSKVEAGQIKVEHVPCDLPELLSEIISLMRPRAAEKGLGFGITFQGSIPHVIQGDPLRLKQILVNLVGNAVKFTDSGRIDLTIADEGEGSPNILLRVDVIDSGIGMTLEQCGRLFRPFTQGDASITRKFGGTGLGLSISRQLAKLLSGDITVISELGIGSTFTLKLDAGPSANVERLQGLTEATLPATTPPTMHTEIHLRGRILLVEDGADNQRLLSMQLNDAGATVTSALNGQIAVELATTHTFDLILMDMQMPVLDGYAATVELRRRGITIPIIALTAHAMAEDRDKCLASGCSGYLAKPIEEDKLLKTVHEQLIAGNLSERDDSAKEFSAEPLPACANVANRIKSSLVGDARIMKIMPDFLGGLPGTVRTMIDLLEHKDLTALQQMAHQLLGACGGYGFGVVSQPARSVEQSIKDRKDLEFITAKNKCLIEMIRRIDGYDESKEQVSTPESVK
jgi:PAS domain S-box-containing protein